MVHKNTYIEKGGIMNNDLFERVLIQLQPELAQEFGKTIIEDEKKLKENLKNHNQKSRPQNQ